MGDLEVRIRHGHGGGPNGALIALAALIVLATAGTAGRAVDHAAHDALAVLEVAAYVVGTLAAAALAVTLVIAVMRIRRELARRRPVRVQPVHLADTVTARPVDDRADHGRAALGPARRLDGWPLPGRWAEVPLDDRGDDPDRYS